MSNTLYNAFQRNYEHTINAINDVKTYTDEKIEEVKDTVLEEALKSGKDSEGNLITETYETKTDASAKLTEAKEYTDTQISTVTDSKQDVITGAASTITYESLAAQKVLISNSNGKVAVSPVSSNELGYLLGVESNIQGQLDNKSETDHTHNYAGSSSAGGAATKAEQDSKGNVIDTTYETKADAEAKLEEAKAYVDEEVMKINGGTVTVTNAKNAEFATKDESGNVITNTYETKADAEAKLEEAKGYTDSKIEKITTNSLGAISLVDGISISSNTDLNTILEVGNYKCTNPNTSKTLINCPTKNSFKMTVANSSLFNGGTYRTQQILDLYGREFFRYTWDNGINWTEWNIKDIGLNTSVDIGDKEYTQSTGRFADEMNRTAMYLGMTKSIFNTACGFNDFITAHDLLRLLIGAKHSPTVFSIMGTNRYRVQVNNSGVVVNHSMLETTNWKNWADENGYTIVATKGGSVKGTSANGYWAGQVGIMNNAMLLQDANGDLYGVSIVGLQNPSDWNETKSYMKYERVKVNDITYMSISDNNLNNPITDTNYWIETVAEIDILRNLIHDLINHVNGATTSDLINNCANAVDREYPVGMGVVKLTLDGTLNEDMECLTSAKFYNENEVYFAASTTKIMTAIVAASQLDNHFCSVISNDIIGGSGHDFAIGDVISTNDALYLMLLISDNTMANMLARDCGKRMSGAVESLSNGFSIPVDSDLNTFTIVGNYKQTNSKNVATFINCPTSKPFKMVVGYSCLMNTGTYKFQEITDLHGEIYWRYTWNNGLNWSDWKQRANLSDLAGNVITETYETKVDASAKLTEAKSYTDELINTHTHTRLSYPTLTKEQKTQIQNLMKEYVKNSSTTFVYYGNTVRNSYANTKCWLEDEQKFGLCCNTFVEMIWMGRDVNDFVGKDKTTYSNKITQYFDWGYYPPFKRRSEIAGLAYRDDEGNITGYFNFKQPNMEDDTDPYKYSYSTTSAYDPDSGLLYNQWFESMQTQADLGQELERLGYGIPVNELDIGDLIFTTPRGDTGSEYKDMRNSLLWKECGHAAMVYDKYEDGTLAFIECTTAISNSPIVRSSTKYSTAWDKCRAEEMLSNIVFCARHPVAWGNNNMDYIRHADGNCYIDYQLMAYQDGIRNNPIPVNVDTDGNMISTPVKQGKYYVCNSKVGKAIATTNATSFDTTFFTNII